MAILAIANFSPQNHFRASTGFKPMASAFALSEVKMSTVMGKDELAKLACSQYVGLHSSVGRALQS